MAIFAIVTLHNANYIAKAIRILPKKPERRSIPYSAETCLKRRNALFFRS